MVERRRGRGKEMKRYNEERVATFRTNIHQNSVSVKKVIVALITSLLRQFLKSFFSNKSMKLLFL